MYLFLNALIMALLLPAGAMEDAEIGPSCRAELKGVNLLTVFELPTGIVVEAPWQVVHRGYDETRAKRHIVFATLDRVIEKDALTGRNRIVPFPEPIRLGFEGETHEAVVENAAEVWCVTVMRAQENQSLDRLSPTEAQHTRITALPEPTVDRA